MIKRKNPLMQRVLAFFIYHVISLEIILLLKVSKQRFGKRTFQKSLETLILQANPFIGFKNGGVIISNPDIFVSI